MSRLTKYLLTFALAGFPFGLFAQSQEMMTNRSVPQHAGTSGFSNASGSSSSSPISTFLSRIGSQPAIVQPQQRPNANPVNYQYQSQGVSTVSNQFPVSVKYEQWFDASRNRSIPVKVYYPSAPNVICPVIVFSHGLGGSYERCSYLGQTWASRGFISVHIQHVGIDEAVWKKKIRPIKELKDVYEQVWSGRAQATDVRFVINQIESLSLYTKNPNSVWQRADMSRLGIAGYDLGGLACMLVAGQVPPDGGESLQDARIKALIVMSPPVYQDAARSGQVYQRMSIPTLFFTGTEDDGVVGTTKSWQRRIPFDYMTVADRFLITYQGADHMIYGGHVRSSKNQDDQKYQGNVAQASLLFWQAYLDDDPAVRRYFQGQTLGGIAGALGRVERRLGATTYAHSMAQMPATASPSNVSPDITVLARVPSHREQSGQQWHPLVVLPGQTEWSDDQNSEIIISDGLPTVVELQ